MADAVSKLYAEIGFKVNQEGLKQAQQMLKEVAQQMSAINQATKNAAREYGIFSKDQAKQDMANAKLATETSRKALLDKKRQLLGFREFVKSENALKKERLAEEKKQAKELATAQKKQSEEAEKQAKATKERVKGMLSTFREFGTGLRNTFVRLTGTGLTKFLDEIYASFGRSISTRNFLMATGMNLGDLQKITHAFANVGSSISQEKIMEDINKLSQGLADISLAKGDVSTYKLIGVAAQRGDINGLIGAIGQALQKLDPAMALNMIRSLGASDDWLQFYKSPQRAGGDWTGLAGYQQKDLEEAQTALAQLRRSFIDLAEQVSAFLAPVFRALADGLRAFYQKLARWIQEGHFEKLSNIVADLIDKFNAWLDSITSDDIQKAWDELTKWAKTKALELVEDLDVIGEGIHSIANKFRWFGFGDKKETAPIVQTGSVLADYNLARRYSRPQTMTYIDNKTINTNISGVEQEKIPETAAEVTKVAQFNPREWVQENMVLTNTNAYIVREGSV